MALVVAMVLDAVFGEPKWLWSRVTHPAVLMGHAVQFLDELLNDGRRVSGVIAVMALLGGAVVLGLALVWVPGWWLDAIVAAVMIAQRSLVEHVQAVGDALRLSRSDGRNAVAKIVGRDVRDMEPADVARGAIESAAENLSDGVIAPVFWFALAGVPGLLAYKVINTADSMIGYRTARHDAFGWAAARLDDLLNWVPARLTAVLIWLVAPIQSGGRTPWRIIRRDAALHRSPNAGWPEAVMAPALGVSLAGPRSYGGVTQDYPWVNPQGRKDAGPNDIDAAVAMLWKSWGLTMLCAVVIALI